MKKLISRNVHFLGSKIRSQRKNLEASIILKVLRKRSIYEIEQWKKIFFINGFDVGIVINVFVVLWIYAHQSYIKY